MAPLPHTWNPLPRAMPSPHVQVRGTRACKRWRSIPRLEPVVHSAPPPSPRPHRAGCAAEVHAGVACGAVRWRGGCAAACHPMPRSLAFVHRVVTTVQGPLVTTYESQLCDSLLGQRLGDWSIDSAEHMREVMRLRLGEALFDNVDIMVGGQAPWCCYQVAVTQACGFLTAPTSAAARYGGQQAC